MSSGPKTITLSRATKETEIELSLQLSSEERGGIESGIGFLDHMLSALSFYAGFQLDLKAEGDLQVDDHHTAEDCAILLGQALEQALGDRSGIERFGYAYAPLDEALARAVVDLSGRPASVVNLGLQREMLGTIACENITHFFQSLATSSRSAIHIDVLRGENDHHRAETAFKALGLALRQALSPTNRIGIPSTKGVLV